MFGSHYDPVEAVHRAIEDQSLCSSPHAPQACPAYQAAMRAVVAYRSWQAAPPHYVFQGPLVPGPGVFHVHVGDGLTAWAHGTTVDLLRRLPFRDVAKADVSLPLDISGLNLIGKDTVPPGQLILLPPQDETKEHPAP
jgi:hypothetical protein